MISWETRSILEQLWCSKCTVWTFEDSFDPTTSQTTQELVEVSNMIDIPCRLSYQQISDVTSKSEAPVVQLVIKLFLPKTINVDGVEEELIIPAGSVISVTQHGRTSWYDRSSTAAVYSNHQEVILNVREAYV